jgi:hypothetical protein
VQRLLRRADASTRRIVCLSAILPSGPQLDDLTAWIRNDAEGAPVKSPWRRPASVSAPLSGKGTSARLSYDLDDDGPFLRILSIRLRQEKRRNPGFLALTAASFVSRASITVIVTMIGLATGSTKPTPFRRRPPSACIPCSSASSVPLRFKGFAFFRLVVKIQFQHLYCNEWLPQPRIEQPVANPT